VFHLRITTSGALNYLDEQFNNDNIELFFDLKTEISGARGKQKKELQTRFHEHFGVQFTNSLLPPNRTWPTLALTQPYTRINPSTTVSSNDATAFSPFDTDLLVLSKLEGPALGLESTVQLTEALRGAVLKACAPDGNAPEWLCGHSTDGAPATRPHLALMPLAFVGSKHADGHLLGLALAIPREVSPRDRARLLRHLLFTVGKDGVPTVSTVTLTLGVLGTWTLSLEERAQPPFALRSETWCHSSTTWATITPVVLDRHPKGKTPDARFVEVRQFIAESCERAGLPRPVEIDVDKTSWHTGAPQSAPKAGGFPLLFAHRQQFHVWLRFPCPVQGPVLIGGGRYRGYGFFKPYRSNQDDE
jgi:CRISPR-associated protein Csb2